MTIKNAQTYPVMAPESIMATKAHGTSAVPVQDDLRWGCDGATADRICNFNRHYAEHSGYFQTTTFLNEATTTTSNEGEITFYDSNTGKPLFIAPRGRTMDQFVKESKNHGWPSFRDEEVVWENVRCVPGGESVSVDGTHLGHNLPDGKGNRYCINLVSVAGRPVGGK
jgi:peptide methionine sulfoxide reductase MsrB